MKTSVIIVSFNTGKFIISCIESVKDFTPKGTEIIVIDNASTDDSVEKIELQKVKLIKNRDNYGYAKAVNQGIKSSWGDYIFVLNPDTQLKKGAVDKMLEFSSNNKNIGVIGPRLLNLDGSLQNSCYHEPTITAAIKEYFLGIKDQFDKYAPSGNMPQKVDAVVGAAMFIPRATVNKVGYFTGRYFMYFEDLDYCRKVRKAGLDVFYLPTAEVVHVHGGITKTVSDKAGKWLINSSKIYHGITKHNLLSFVLWSGQKWNKFTS